MLGDNYEQPKVEEAEENESNDGHYFPKSAIILLSILGVLMIACIIVIAVLSKK